MRWLLAVVCALSLAGTVHGQPERIVRPVERPALAPPVAWQGERPAFVHGLFFADDPWGAPLRPPRDERARRWGFYVWGGTPLWLVVEVDGAPEGRRLCVTWPDPAGKPAAETCQVLPRGPARLAFAGPDTRQWPEGRYAALLSLAPAVDVVARRHRIGEVAYAIGQDLPHTVPRAAAPVAIPTFPWPPPRPTTRAVLERALLAADAATLGEVAERLTAALGRAGYAEHSFYAVPGGFALATRLEQIEFDGTPIPEPARWSMAFPPRERFSLADYIRALFTAPEAHYRVIVFVVTDRPFRASDETVGPDEALAWIGAGLDRLPDPIGRNRFGPQHAGTALIYQFRKIGHEREPIPNPDGAAAAAHQLERSRILTELGR
jgi:hypothetical protein